MHLLKKTISLLLVVAMLSSFALVASAEGENLLLEAYRADGTKINTGETVTAGEKIKVRIVTTDEVICNAFVVLVSYDSNVLKANKNDSTYGDIASSFNDEEITVFTTDKRDEEAVPVGTPAIQLTLGAGKKNITAPAGTVWAEFDFTALAETTGTTLTAHLTDGTVLKEVDHGDEGTLLDPFKLEGIVPGSVTLGISAAPVPVETVTLDKDKLSLAQGATEQLTATVLPDDADDKTVTWESEDDTIATVADGLVTGVSEGSTKITATAGNVTATCDVSVAAEGVIPVTGVTISGSNPRSYNITASPTIVAQVTPTAATNVGADDVVWTSSNTDVATVAQVANKPTSGKLTFKSTGQTVITVSVGGYSASITVNVTKPITGVTMSATTAQMAVGDKLHLTATVNPADTTDDPTVTWSTNAAAVATVGQDGTVTALSKGTATITAKAGAKSATCKVTVIELKEGTYTVSMPEDQKIAAGDTVSLTVKIGTSDESVTDFSAFDMKFTYVPEALDLVTTELSGYTVTANDGNIRVIGYGDKKPLGDAFTLQFQAKDKAGETKVTVTSALVGISDTALTENAKKAALTKADTTLTVQVQYAVTLPDGMGSDQGTLIDEGTNYVFKVTDEDAAYWNYTVSATMGGESVTVKDNGDGSYTIENVTGALVITKEKAGKEFSVTLTGEDVTGDNSAVYGTNYTFTVDKKDGYTYTITAKISGTEYTGVTGPDESGKYTIPGSDIKGPVEIQVVKAEIHSPDKYDVFIEGTGKAAVTAPEKATKDQDFTFTVKWEDGYVYTVSININGSDYAGVTPVDSADGTSKTYTIPGKDVVGPIVLTVDQDKAFSVTWDIQKPNEIEERNITEVTAEKKVGTDYTFTIKNMMKVYKLVINVKEDGVERTVTVKTADAAGNGKATRYDHTCTVENVQGNLEITLSWVVDTDLMKVKVTPFVELDGKTVFMVATRVTDGIAKESDRIGIMLDTYDGYGMYLTKGTLYADMIEGSAKDNANTCIWLVTVEDGTPFNEEIAMQHLTYTNRQGVSKPDESVNNTADVNKSGLIDVNDAQLVYDIYNNVYQHYCMTNKLNSIYVETQTGATMIKFILADVNKNMCVDALDAVAVIDQIK